MAKCDYCNSTIFFGGVKQGGVQFCNKKCYQNGALKAVSSQIPPEVIQQQVSQVHQGQCPKCQGPGPVDVHTSHQVFSFLVLTRWTSKPQVSCRSCGVKSQLNGMALSLVCGWWGIPWGIILTPVQIGRNIVGLVRPPEVSRPSMQLEKMVKLHLASRIAAPPSR
jgi:hypothetical protein